MSNILIMASRPITAIAASRGTGVDNLLSASPKEVWADSASAGTVTINVDLGSVMTIDTIFLGTIWGAGALVTRVISGGTAGYTDAVIAATQSARAVDAAGQAAEPSHMLWTGAAVMVRYLRIALTYPAGNAPLMAGVVMVGRAFRPTYNQEWGAGRRVIDTGSATNLPDGGFATVEGGRKGSYSFMLGDLTNAEVDALYELQLAVGETRPLLIVEDPDRTTGQVHRIHYGLFRSLRQFERRTPGRTRWEMTIEQWV